MGTPTTALGSVPRSTLAMSPDRLTISRMTASQYPHSAPRHRPTAAAAQAAQTVHISTIAHTPIAAKPSRARGLRRHIGSRKLPGKSSDTKDMKLMVAPNRKNMLRAVMPIGRVSGSVVFIVARRLTPELTGEQSIRDAFDLANGLHADCGSCAMICSARHKWKPTTFNGKSDHAGIF